MNPPPKRKSDFDIQPQFLSRWSPRAFDSSPIDPKTRDALFEAARWAPSCFNAQPWRFVYADDETSLGRFRSLLLDGNRVWADRAPLLAFVLANKRFSHNDKPNDWAAFDAGAAWMSLALQAEAMGLAAHAMGGFRKEEAYPTLGVSSEDCEILAAIAIGKPGDPKELPEELAQREFPSERLPLSEILSKDQG